MQIVVEKDWCTEEITATIFSVHGQAQADRDAFKAWQEAPVGTIERAEKKALAMRSAVKAALDEAVLSGGITPVEATATLNLWDEEYPSPASVEPTEYFDSEEGYVRFPDFAGLTTA